MQLLMVLEVNVLATPNPSKASYECQEIFTHRISSFIRMSRVDTLNGPKLYFLYGTESATLLVPPVLGPVAQSVRAQL